MSPRIPAIVLGGTGYVAGELLRLLATHPVAKAFPHLAPVLGDLRFVSEEGITQLVTTLPTCALFSAAPHGVSAALIDRLLTAAAAAGTEPRVVDISADYRYATPEAYAAVYKHAHGAPARIKDFTCAVPEHLAAAPTPHVAHPGCFARITRSATPTCIRTTRSRTATRPRSARSRARPAAWMPTSTSCRTRDRSRVASTSPCRPSRASRSAVTNW